jgi:hypothetical protein
LFYVLPDSLSYRTCGPNPEDPWRFLLFDNTAFSLLAYVVTILVIDLMARRELYPERVMLSLEAEEWQPLKILKGWEVNHFNIFMCI